MRVVDTSAWIEWLIGGPLHKTLRKEFPQKAQCVVPTIVQLELAKWLVREAGEDQADQAIAFTQKCVVAPLDTRIALSAAAIKVRTGQVAPNLAKQSTARVHEFAQKHCTVAVPGREEFRRAAALAGDGSLKLRAGGALHLAIAESLSAQGILCLDDAMIESAKSLGMNVVMV